MKIKVFKITLNGVPTGEYYYNDLCASEAARLMNSMHGGNVKPYRVRIGYIVREN